MTILIWLLGIVLSIQMIAAWYGIVDNWQQLHRFRYRVTGNIVLWTGLYLLMGALLPISLADALSSGFWTVAIVYGMYLITGPLLLPLYSGDNRKKVRQYLDAFSFRKESD